MQVPRVVLLGSGMVFGALLLGWRLHAFDAEAAPVVAAPATFTAPAVAMASPEAPLAGAAPVAPGTVLLPPGAEQALRATAPPDGPVVAPAALRARPAAVPAPAGSASAAAPPDGPDHVDGLSVVANGDHIVVASDGAIVSVGDDTVVKGNTGDAGASGAIAVDVNGSDVTSGTSDLSVPPATFAAPPWGTVLPGTSTAGTPYASAGLPYVPGGTSAAPGTRSTSINGYENRALEVAGSDNLLTYDDSTLFFQRVGDLNGNTGDTQTSGLNVVDAAGSRVTSGDTATLEGRGALVPSAYGGSWLLSPAGGLPAPVPGGWSASVADGNSIATATAQDSLVIGGDGVRDSGVSMIGERNVVTDDDGNVAVGGVGDVNAQVGDSRTSGAVVMGVQGSDIRSGASLVPAAQAGVSGW